VFVVFGAGIATKPSFCAGKAEKSYGLSCEFVIVVDKPQGYPNRMVGSAWLAFERLLENASTRECDVSCEPSFIYVGSAKS